MTGQDFQDRLDAIVLDLQTKGKGQRVEILFRDGDNHPNILSLSSDGAGVVNAQELAAVQAFVNDLKLYADDYTANYAPVQTALDNFKTAQAPHQASIDAAAAARKTLDDELKADQSYQTAKTNLEDARSSAAYINAKTMYDSMNVSENYSELQQAKGAYTA